MLAVCDSAENKARHFRGYEPMNHTLSLLYSHRSDRSFTDEPVSDETLCSIVEAARRAPTSSNAQHVSVVVVRDAAQRTRIAEYAGGQAWIAKAPVFIAVVLDFYKTGLGIEAAGETSIFHETVEGLLAGVTDVGIALAAMMTAARSLGLGIVCIGGIRRNSQGMIDLLKLPPRSFPVVGLSIGHVQQPAQQKPRLPMETFRHDDCYHPEQLPADIAAYDATLLQYWQTLGRADGKAWSANTAEAYKQSSRRPVQVAMQKQGITHDK
jgi:FMN reductase [NAD(P)H]